MEPLSPSRRSRVFSLFLVAAWVAMMLVFFIGIGSMAWYAAQHDSPLMEAFRTVGRVIQGVIGLAAVVGIIKLGSSIAERIGRARMVCV